MGHLPTTLLGLRVPRARALRFARFWGIAQLLILGVPAMGLGCVASTGMGAAGSGGATATGGTPGSGGVSGSAGATGAAGMGTGTPPPTGSGGVGGPSIGGTAGSTTIVGSGGSAGAGTGSGIGGRVGTGGSLGAGGGLGSGAGGATGGTVTWMATDYLSRKWARWPIPNPVSLGLPHPMSYTAATDTLTDNVTGLVWQRTTNTATTDWPTALAACTALGAGWSLPTRIELTSILDNARSGAKVDPMFTFGNAAGWTWASTPWVVNARKTLTGAAALSWFINFSLGDSNNSLSQTAPSAYARCVRVPATQALPAEHYAVTSGEVKDNYTGLIWQQDHSGATADLAWSQADVYCKGLTLNGQTWRLPSLNEIASIVDDVPAGNVSPAVDHVAFPATSPNLQYWSASPYGTSTAERWTMNFTDGFTAHRPIATLAIARCVR